MANTYEWIFDPIEVKQTDELANVASVIHWRLNGTSDDGFVESKIGSVQLEDADTENFVPFDSDGFTKDLVKSWVIAALRETEDNLKESIAADLDLQRTPATVQKKPASW
jgi:hypothetical protein